MTQAHSKSPSPFKEFFARHQKTMIRSLLIILSAILAACTSLLAFPLALLVLPSACQLAGGICNVGKATGIMLFSVGALIVFICVYTLALRKLAKTKWATSLEAALISLALFWLFTTLPAQIMQEYMLAGLAGLMILGAVMFAALSVFAVYTLEALNKWSHLATVGFVVLFFAFQPFIANLAQEAHKTFAQNQEYRQSQDLPFQAYTPAYMPAGYTLVAINVSPPTVDAPKGYKLDYSTGGKENSFGRDTKVITIIEEPSAYYGQSICNLALYQTVPCTKIANTTLCNIYSYTHHYIKENDVSYFCTINKTQIHISAVADDLSDDQAKQIFASLQPGVAELH